MSLISDPDFLIHSIRLQYLRNVEDAYGPRLISLDPSYRSNPYVVDAGLADIDRWPELAFPSNPTPSDDEANPPRGGRPSGPHGGGAPGLKYTTTIMGPSRTGALGLRVTGRRASLSAGRRASVRRSVSQPPAVLAVPERREDARDTTPTLPASASPRTADVVRSAAEVEIKVDAASPVEPGPASGGSALPSSSSASTTPNAQPTPQPPPANIPIPFIPKFRGAEEMEARRQMRMRNRIAPGNAPRAQVTAPPAYLNPELSSSSSSSALSVSDVEDHGAIPEEDEDDDDDDDDLDDEDNIGDGVIDMMDDDDVFDPEFAGSRGTMLDDMSDSMSIMSGSQSMTSASDFSITHSSLPHMGSVRNNSSRLSPVRESHTNEEKSTEVTPERGAESHNVDSYFEMVTPPPPAGRAAKGGDGPKTHLTISSATAPPALHSPGGSSSSSSLFVRRPVAPARAGKSALTAMLASENDEASENPFTELYSAISGRSEPDSMNVQVYFPHASKPAGKPMKLNVRKDASMEEVLGFALWSYWEESWLPKIDEGLDGEEDPKWATMCSAIGWIMRIAEDDGEVDEDFPIPDRTLKVSKFAMSAFAVLKASESQILQNKITESKIQRRRSRIVLKKKKSAELLKAAGPSTGGLVPPDQSILGMSASTGPTSMLGSSLGLFPSSFGPSSMQGPPQFLRIRNVDLADADIGHVSTTIQAHGGMYMAEVLDAVCAKRKLEDPKEYALVLDLKPVKLFIPLDRTVKSLQGKRDLMLIRKSMLQTYGVDMGKRITGRSSDPNASIFKRTSEVPEQPSALDYTTAYKRFTVYRKVPMLVTRSARLLAIDGGYIHIMPQANKAKNVFESGKTASYDIKSIVTVQQSGKNSATFKLVVPRDAERNKRYEFEAESPKMAAEIVQTIKSLKQQLERSGTNKQSRRSRHVA